MRINNPQNFEGQGLISKEELGLTAEDVLVTSGKVDAEFLPELTLKGTSVGDMGQKINFIGNCNVVQNADGSITIRIGDNLNSSNFATTDGQTTGVNTVSVSSPSATAGTLSDGSSVNAIKSGSYTLDTSTASALIHFDNNTSTTFEVVVSDNGVEKTYVFGPITGDGTYTAETGVTLTVTNFGPETKTAEGATGYCGNIAFSIAASAIAGGDTSSVAVKSVTHKNGAEGTFSYTITSNNTRYFYTDTTTVPSSLVASLSVTKSTTTKTVSGVKYYTGATANYGIAYENIATPVCISNNVVFDNSGWAADKTVSAPYNSTSAEGTGAVVNGAWLAGSTNKVTYNVKNINGTTSTSLSLEESLFIDNRTDVDTATVANFNIETTAGYPRLNADLTQFDNTKYLGAEDLMILSGYLCYPTQDFSAYNTSIGFADMTGADGETATANPNYSGSTGTRYWYRKFYAAGDKNTATLTFKAASTIASTAFGNTLTVLLGKLDSEGKVAAWYDATKDTNFTGNGTTTFNGIATSIAANVLKVDWGSYGAASYGVIIRLGMSANSHKIDSLTVALA